MFKFIKQLIHLLPLAHKAITLSAVLAVAAIIVLATSNSSFGKTSILATEPTHGSSQIALNTNDGDAKTSTQVNTSATNGDSQVGQKAISSGQTIIDAAAGTTTAVGAENGSDTTPVSTSTSGATQNPQTTPLSPTVSPITPLPTPTPISGGCGVCGYQPVTDGSKSINRMCPMYCLN